MFKKFYKIIFALIAINTISINLNSMQAPNNLKGLLDEINNEDQLEWLTNKINLNKIPLFVLKHILAMPDNDLLQNIKASLKANYKQLVRRYHPDKNGTTKLATLKFQVLSAAYQKLIENPIIENIFQYLNSSKKIFTFDNSKKIIDIYFSQDQAKARLMQNKSQELISNELKEKLLIINFLALWDVINTIQDINKITVLGKDDPSKIKLIENIDMIRNMINLGLVHVKIDFLKSTDYLFSNNLLKSARFLHLIPNIYSVKFINNNSKIINSADKIANYNKSINRDLSKTKIYQYAWLAINKLAPYIGFACARKYYENKNIFKAFTDSAKLNNQTINIFEILILASNISEIFRKNQLYKAEMGAYENYFKNKDTNTK